MTFSNQDENVKWQELHLEFQDILNKELSVKREIFSHLRQEEYAILIGDQAVNEYLRQEQSVLDVESDHIVAERNQVVESLQSVIGAIDLATLFEMIKNLDPDMGCETEILYVQVISMTEEMERQEVRNQKLIEVVKTGGILSEKQEEPRKTKLLTLEDME